MLRDATGFSKIYIACGYTDLRCGINTLTVMIQDKFHLDTCQKNVLFLFCGRRTDRIKGLLWEGDGWLLLYKRLENRNDHFQWPRTTSEALLISERQLRLLMDGFSVYGTINEVFEPPKYRL